MHHSESTWMLDHRGVTVTPTSGGMDEDVNATEDNDDFDTDTDASDDVDLSSWCSDISLVDSGSSDVDIDV